MFVEFINQYVKLYHEKRAELEEEQRHLTRGLQKLKDTYSQVEQLQASLTVKRKNLQEKKDESSKILQQIIADQRLAEQEKLKSQQLRVVLAQKQKEIAVQHDEVQRRLDTVEPTLNEAKQGIQRVILGKPALLKFLFYFF